MSDDPYGIDPRVRRIQQMLFEALSQLLTEKSFEEVSVQNLAVGHQAIWINAWKIEKTLIKRAIVMVHVLFRNCGCPTLIQHPGKDDQSAKATTLTTGWTLSEIRSVDEW